MQTKPNQLAVGLCVRVRVRARNRSEHGNVCIVQANMWLWVSVRSVWHDNGSHSAARQPHQQNFSLCNTSHFCFGLNESPLSSQSSWYHHHHHHPHSSCCHASNYTCEFMSEHTHYSPYTVGAVSCFEGGFILRKRTQRAPLFIAFYRTKTAEWQLDSPSEWWRATALHILIRM